MAGIRTRSSSSAQPRRPRALQRPRRRWLLLVTGIVLLLVAPQLPDLNDFVWMIPGLARQRRQERMKKAAEEGEEHHGHGEHEHLFAEFWHKVGSSPRLLMAEVCSVVLLSTLFETGEHHVRHRLEAAGDEVGGKILDALFKEFTGLGFIALLLYLSLQSGMTDAVAMTLHEASKEELEHENPVAETFETVHMMIFMLLIVLLAQAAAILLVSRRVAEKWSEYEQTRSFGSPESSMESKFVQAGYLERVPNEEASRGFDLVLKKPFTYAESWWTRSTQGLSDLQVMVRWRAIRHDFLFGIEGFTKSLIPSPATFSFRSYLTSQLGETVLHLVEVHPSHWLASLAVTLPIAYFCVTFPSSVQMVQFLCSASLLLVGWGLGACLECDMQNLSPKVPEDPRHILNTMSGTSTGLLQTSVSASKGTMPAGSPGMGDTNPLDKKARLGVPPFPLCKKMQRVGQNPINTRTYELLLGLLGFWQAMSVTSLIISPLSRNFSNWVDVTFYFLSWAEWPIMIFLIVPTVIRKLTLRNSVGVEADIVGIRRVSMEGKESLIRYHVQLIEMVGYQRRRMAEAEVTKYLPPSPAGHRRQRHGPMEGFEPAYGYKEGTRLYEAMTERMKSTVAKLYEQWDINNDGSVEVEELAHNFIHLVPESEDEAATLAAATEIAANLVRCVDHDGTGEMDLHKTRALVALCGRNRPEGEAEEDLKHVFQLVDTDGSDSLDVYELATWLGKMTAGIVEDEIGSMLFRYFGTGKPALNQEDFVDWFLHIKQGDGSGGGHGHGHGGHH